MLICHRTTRLNETLVAAAKAGSVGLQACGARTSPAKHTSPAAPIFRLRGMAACTRGPRRAGPPRAVQRRVRETPKLCPPRALTARYLKPGERLRRADVER